MNRRHLVEKVSTAFNTTQVNAKDILDIFVWIIEDSLLSWEEVNIQWFGSFKILRRKSKKGFNPKTREAIVNPAYSTPVFKAWLPLKRKIRAKFN
jgi:DNA-binding protein HU-beta